MTKNIKTLFAMTAVVAILISCEERAEKKAENADEKVQDAQDDLKEAENDAEAAREEYRQYQLENENRMSQYDLTIAELKEEANKADSKTKVEYNKRIGELEERNNGLKAKMKSFQYDGKDKWQEFQREFEHDMDDLGKSLKEFTVDNKK